MEKKITKAEMFATIKEMAAAAGRADIVDFCDAEMTSLANKAAKAKERAAAKRAEGDALRDAIQAVLTAEFQTVADILAALNDADATPSKISNRMKALIEAGVAEKTKVSVSNAEGKKSEKVAYRLIGQFFQPLVDMTGGFLYIRR